MMYALLLALFLPLSLLFEHATHQQQASEEAQLQGTVYYVDQLRGPLQAYWVEHKPNEGEEAKQVSFEALRELLPTALNERTVGEPILQYIDQRGFYLVWEQPPPGLANALIERYTRAVDQSSQQGKKEQPWQLVFYHIGFVNEKGELKTTRRYRPDNQQWKLPAQIKEGALVFTNCEPDAAS